MSDLSFDSVRAYISVVKVNEVVANVSHSLDGRVCKSNQDEAQVYNNDILPPVRTNGIPIGGMTIPSELVKVRYQDRDTFIQVFYDNETFLLNF